MKSKLMALTAVLAMTFGTAWAAGPSGVLQPPAGHRMALVVFEDLECPACAKIDPVLTQAVRNYGIPLVRHDFVIPNHPWSKEAHIMARYFDRISPQLGEEFRQYIFANQQQIYKTNLRQWADRFAASHRTALPAFYDPDGSLRAKVEADTMLGRNLNIHLTPTIWVVTNSPQMPPVEVTEQSKLFETIERVKSQLPAQKATSEKKARKK